MRYIEKSQNFPQEHKILEEIQDVLSDIDLEFESSIVSHTVRGKNYFEGFVISIDIESEYKSQFLQDIFLSGGYDHVNLDGLKNNNPIFQRIIKLTGFELSSFKISWNRLVINLRKNG